MSRKFKEFLESNGIQQTTTLPYSHQQNATVERANQEVRRHIDGWLLEQGLGTDWVEKLPYVQRTMNSSEHSALQVAPALLRFGRNPFQDKQREKVSVQQWQERCTDQVQQITEKVQEVGRKRKLSFEQDESGEHLVPGSWVMIINHNYRKNDLSQPKHLGPYQVVEQKDSTVTIANRSSSVQREGSTCPRSTIMWCAPDQIHKRKRLGIRMYI